jgi:phosphate transport system permease protein
MPSLIIVVAVLLVLTAAYQLGFRRSLALARGNGRTLHSRPGFHGAYVLLWCAVPAVIVAVLWFALQPTIVAALAGNALPPEIAAMPEARQGLELTKIRNAVEALHAGRALSASLPPYAADAARHYVEVEEVASTSFYIVLAAAALGGLAFAGSRVAPQMRARNRVEAAIRAFFILCSSIAIITTFAIVLSLLFEAIHFFAFISPFDFFFGLVWDPRFAAAGGTEASYGQFGLLPVLWGTIFISAIAMLVAVPLGLLSAIYLSEYAGRRLRSVAKPLIEILAGIPTVVYGFFALSTVGPFLRDFGTLLGFDVSASSALSAGVVMGIMIIPFVSSLSDDIINAVPQTLRDGSYAMGATQSETIRKVIFPAALPGIVGAVLLAVSRAIGETMIVVMAAGIAANLTINPFESVTTVTVKIVNQLTGDQDFSSPQALVAFALALALFVITLGLNVIALYIVRKYREQYE